MKEKKKKTKINEKIILGWPANFEMGQKVKNISVDIRKFSNANLISLIILNLLLIGVMIYYLNVVFNVGVLVIALFTIAGAMIWSFLSYKLGVLKIRYILYENAIVKDYDSSISVGDLSKLKGFKIRKVLLDRCGKPTYTLTLHFDNKFFKTINFTCINEDVNKLMYQINLLAKQAQKKQKEKTEIPQEESLIESMIIENLPQSKLTEEQTKIEKLAQESSTEIESQKTQIKED